MLIEAHQLGGSAWGPQEIENFPGFPEGITGKGLMKRFIDQAERFGVEIKKKTQWNSMILGMENGDDPSRNL